jgi:hypothetical protein
MSCDVLKTLPSLCFQVQGKKSVRGDRWRGGKVGVNNYSTMIVKTTGTMEETKDINDGCRGEEGLSKMGGKRREHRDMAHTDTGIVHPSLDEMGGYIGDS